MWRGIHFSFTYFRGVLHSLKTFEKQGFLGFYHRLSTTYPQSLSVIHSKAVETISYTLFAQGREDTKMVE